MMAAWHRGKFALRRDHTLGTLLERLAQVNGSRALVDEVGHMTLDYRQGAKRVARWAGGVQRIASPGDVIVVATPNGYEQLLLCLAISRAGAIPAPVNDAMRPEEIDHVVADSGAVAVVRSANDVDGGEPLLVAVPAQPTDVAALFYTSGTTGKPKGAALTHNALVGSAMQAVVLPPVFARPAVLSLPVAHIMGFAALIGMACAGITTVFLPRFSATEVLDTIEDRKASMFVGVPAMYRQMLADGAADRDLSSIRVWGSGADVMPADLAAAFKRFGATTCLPFIGGVGEAMFAEGYGMVETGGGVAAKISPPYLPIGLGDSVGFPIPGYQLKVVDDDGTVVRPGETGELVVKGPGVLTGYWHDADATAAVLGTDGWLRTGDLARRGAFNTVLFAGRKKDVIKRGGFSVYAVEVEAGLEEHPAVREAAVVPIPDDRLGEVPAAAVILREGATATGEEIKAWAKQHLSAYKAPVTVLIVDELPRTGTKKIQRREVIPLFD